jgi:hypothetical protein
MPIQPPNMLSYDLTKQGGSYEPELPWTSRRAILPLPKCKHNSARQSKFPTLIRV